VKLLSMNTRRQVYLGVYCAAMSGFDILEEEYG
jgi:hypothetical protein